MLWGICHGVLGPPRGLVGRSLLGYQTIRALGSPAGGADSLKTRFTGGASDGDIYIASVWTSSSYRLQLRQDGTYWFDAGGDQSRQLILADLYAVATSSLAGEGTLAINDSPPRPTAAGGTLFSNATYPRGQALNLQLQAQDPQGDAITFSVSGGTIFPGGSLSNSGLVTGTPTTYGAFGFTVRLTDPYGAFSDSPEVVTVASVLPDFTGQLLSAAQATLAGLGVGSSNSPTSSALPLNTIISQSIPAGTVISSTGVSVAFVISNGALFVNVPNLFPPNLAGITFDSTRTMEWSTSYQETLTGKVTTLARMQYPIVHWELVYELLDAKAALNELKQIAGLFNQKQAQAGTFLYLDPIFNTVAAEPFGTGDGATKQFQLVAAYGNSGGPSVKEMIQQLQAAPTLFDNGSAISTSAYTINATGIVTFTTAPTSGHALTWSGSFFYLAQFETDELDPTEFMDRFWELHSLKIKSVLQ